MDNPASPEHRDVKKPQSSNKPNSSNHFPGKFPKELNKNYIASADWRFLGILFFSFLFHIVFIYVLETHLKNLDESEFIIKIQNQYASRFLSETYQQEQPNEQPGYQNLLLSASEYVDELVQETFDPSHIADPLPLITPVPDLPGARRERSFEERAMARESTARYRKRSMAVLRDQVKSIGLLGIITSGSGLVSVEEVEDILNYADTSAMNIQEKIAQVRSLKVPRPGVDYFGKGLGDDPNVYVKSRNPRARRVLASGIKGNDFAASLAETQTQHVRRTENFEDTRQLDEEEPIAGLSSRPKIIYDRWDINRIRNVVLAHSPAIQDCYRSQLKYNPGLKGKIMVRFTIDVNGRVTEAEILRTEMNVEDVSELEQCILQRMLRWNDFGRVSPDQGKVSIRHTYVFEY